MSTGIITTAILLIIGYVVVTKVIGLALRVAVPLILILALGSAGALSSLMPDRDLERHPVDTPLPYERTQHLHANDIGDLSLRDIVGMVVDGARPALQGALTLLDSLSEPEPGRSPSRDDRPARPEQEDTHPAPSYFDDDLRHGEARRGW